MTETNHLSSNQAPPDHHVPFYQKLTVYLKNRKSQDFKSLLGFDDVGSTYRLGDLWLDEASFTKNLRQLLGQKVWSTQHKKVLMRASRGKAGESTVSKVNAEIDAFYAEAAQSFKNVFGWVSAKRLQEYLERI